MDNVKTSSDKMKTKPAKKGYATHTSPAVVDHGDDTGPAMQSPLDLAHQTIESLLSDMFDSIRALESVMRPHMPNSLYEDTDAEAKAEDGYETPGDPSPTMVNLYSHINRLHRAVTRVRYLRKHVVV